MTAPAISAASAASAWRAPAMRSSIPKRRGFTTLANGDRRQTMLRLQDDAACPTRKMPGTGDAHASAEDPFKGEVPILSIVPKQDRRYSDKVIRLAEHRPPNGEKGLSPGERIAFREIGDRLKKESGVAADEASGQAALRGDNDQAPRRPSRPVPRADEHARASGTDRRGREPRLIVDIQPAAEPARRGQRAMRTVRPDDAASATVRDAVSPRRPTAARQLRRWQPSADDRCSEPADTAVEDVAEPETNARHRRGRGSGPWPTPPEEHAGDG